MHDMKCVFYEGKLPKENSLKGKVNPKTKLLTQDRTSKMMNFSKKKYVKIINILVVFKASSFAVPLKFRKL